MRSNGGVGVGNGGMGMGFGSGQGLFSRGVMCYLQKRSNRSVAPTGVPAFFCCDGLLVRNGGR